MELYLLAFIILYAFSVWIEFERFRHEKKKDENGKVGRGKDGKFISLK
jgi:hypothetical protein